MVCFIIPGITPTLHGFTQAYSHSTMHSNSFLNRQTTAHTYTKKEPPVNGSCLNRNLYAGKYLSWTLTFFLWMEAIYSHYLGFLLTWFEIWSKSTLSTIKPLFAAPDLNFDDDINDLFCKPFWRIRDWSTQCEFYDLEGKIKMTNSWRLSPFISNLKKIFDKNFISKKEVVFVTCNYDKTL